jgi:AcrR family transcriptional regulator
MVNDMTGSKRAPKEAESRERSARRRTASRAVAATSGGGSAPAPKMAAPKMAAQKTAASKTAASKRASPSRRQKSAATREAILAAALDEFSARGFAATRLDDVARRAAVAKGTIYVHFRDKETLFEELVRAYLGPVVGFVAAAPSEHLPVRAFAERLIDTFVREVLGTRRRDVLRLVLTEGPRFPQLAHIYYREVISRALPLVRKGLRQAHTRGELKTDALVRFPQLLVAPALMAVIWDALFSRFEPLDTAALLRAHLDLIFDEGSGR